MVEGRESKSVLVRKEGDGGLGEDFGDLEMDVGGCRDLVGEKDK